MTTDNCCFHCDQPLPRENPLQFLSVMDEKKCYFCCPACQTVATTIHALGLAQYYRQRDSKPKTAANFSPSIREPSLQLSFADMDILAEQPQLVQSGKDGCSEAQLFIPDIHCASCCWLIEQRLKHLEGVARADVQLNTHKLTLRWRKDKLPFSHIFAALHEIGYRATPWQPTEQQETLRTKQKQLLQKIGVAGLLAMQIHMIAMGSYFGALPAMQQWMNSVALLLSLPVWFYSAEPFFTSAWRNLKHFYHQLQQKNQRDWRTAFAGSMDVPVALAIVAAALASIIAVLHGTDDVYFDSIAMFVFLLLGARFLETQARNRVAAFAQEPLLPQTCTRLQDTHSQRIAVSELQHHDSVLLQPGIIPVDGVVLQGSAAVEQAAITGEFLPVQKQQGDQVIAGTTLISGELVVQAAQWGASSHIAALHRRMEHALTSRQNSTATSQHFYDNIAQFFTPAVLLIASGSAAFWYWTEPTKALPAFLAVLVASCPCALSLAIPAALTAATLQLRRRGILVTGSHVLHTLPSIFHYVFDKTGTLTQGRMFLINTETHSTLSETECIAIACALECHATHPIARAFTQHTSTANAVEFPAQDVTHILHCGVEGKCNGDTYRLGKPHWVCAAAIDSTNANAGHTDNTSITVALSRNDSLLAVFHVGDLLRTDSAACIQQLQACAIHCAILSGDHSNAVDATAAQLHIGDVYKNCSPEQKVEHLENLKQQHGAVLMVGDGINDGPVLAHADVSIALADASQTAQLAADVILLNNQLHDLLSLRDAAFRTRRIARQNLAWALIYNISVLPLAAAGFLSPVTAAIGMALSSLLVTGNALRLFKSNEKAN